MKVTNYNREFSGRAYINAAGELVMGISTSLNDPTSTKVKGIPPTDIACAKADNADAETLSMMLTGLSRENYFLNMISMAVDWLVEVKGMSDEKAMSMLEQPLVCGWWYNNFINREKCLAAAMADYFDKRVKLQPQKLDGHLKRVAAQKDTYQYWLRMHTMAFIKDTWQWRRLNESWEKLRGMIN